MTEQLHALADQIAMPCCIMSVEQLPDGSCGEVRIVYGNKAYRDTMGPAYHNDMPYQELVPQDNKFEEYCFQSAINGKRMHAYVETAALDCWTDQTMIPLSYKDGNKGYCQFVFEFTPKAEAGRMASVSIGAAESVISACIHLMGRDDFEGGMSEVADEIMKASGAKACRIMSVNHDTREAAILCERAAPGAWPEHSPENDVITYDLISSWESAIGVSNELTVNTGQDMKKLARTHPDWVKSMKANGVKNLILAPLKREKRVTGYLYVVNYDINKAVQVKEMIELLSFFLGVWISNHQLMEELQEISTVDAMTKVYNRRSLIQHIDRLRKSEKKLGVVNLDINGLKKVNDYEGHEAGDRLIIRAAELIRRAFGDYAIYRAGGDEFLVIAENISREEFERKMADFRETAKEFDDVSLAAGSCWSGGGLETDQIFYNADKGMYADKQAYYEKNGCRYRK